MNVVYDPKADTLHLELKPGPVAESDEHKPGIIFDYDAKGNIVSIEILDASRNVAEVKNVRFQIAAE
jgi:uncharacterized protein YuzE